MAAGLRGAELAWTAEGLEEGQFRLRIINLLKELPTQVLTEEVIARISELSNKELNIAVLSLFSQLFHFAAQEVKRFEVLKTRTLSLEGLASTKRDRRGVILGELSKIEGSISQHPLLVKVRENDLEVSESEASSSLKHVEIKLSGRMVL